jgi:hypothetical protein
MQSQTANSQSGEKQTRSFAKTKKRTVKQLDGTKLFGLVEVTDDYTIRITNDWGIIRLPIAKLSDSDFRKYGFKKDRSKDGRFWYERKEALQEFKGNPKSKKDSGESSSLEIRLAEISAFEPIIAAYKKTLPPKDVEKSSTTVKPGNNSENRSAAFQTVLSQPNSVALLPQKLSRSATVGIRSVADVPRTQSPP